jgi:hypothetical protein
LVYLPGYPGVVVAQTAPVPASGTYFINASALLSADVDDGAFCYVTPTSSETDDGFYGGGGGLPLNFQSVGVTDSWYLGVGDSIQMMCFNGLPGAYTFIAEPTITATLINNAVYGADKKQHVPRVSKDPRVQR